LVLLALGGAITALEMFGGLGPSSRHVGFLKVNFFLRALHDGLLCQSFYVDKSNEDDSWRATAQPTIVSSENDSSLCTPPSSQATVVL
jgi:hypothetical protein